MSILQIAHDSIALQAQQVSQLSALLNPDFEQAVQAIHQSKGRLVISGIGKSAIVAQKIVATCNSTGTPSLFMHAADAIHGDLGMLLPNDVIIIISKSGTSQEIVYLTSLVKKFGNTLIALCGNVNSILAQEANFVINSSVEQEACPNNLAPTTSTTAQMVMGDALAICLLHLKGFTEANFAKFHPGGALGKQLYLKVADVSNNNAKPSISANANIDEVILSISSNRLGATAVLAGSQIVGIITDGDLRRMMQTHKSYNQLQAKDIMSKNPKTISNEAMAIDALALMQQNNISQLICMNNKEFCGFVHIHDLLKEGLF
jgi:arabinose-5-phosphate isomerase